MAQLLNLGAALGASKTGLTIGYILQDMDGTTQAAFTTTNVVETSVAGSYVVTVPVSVADAGARIGWGISGTIYAWGVIDAVPSVALTATAVTAVQSGLATATNVSDAQTVITDAIDDLPGTAAIVTAIMAYAVETGHSLDVVMKALYAGIRGKSVADDDIDPTEVAYYAPDNSTVRFTHTLTDTERTVA